MAYPSKVNPITTASQYGLMQAIAHGGILRQDFEITPEVAREMIEKTPRKLRSKFAAELAERRYDMRTANVTYGRVNRYADSHGIRLERVRPLPKNGHSKYFNIDSKEYFKTWRDVVKKYGPENKANPGNRSAESLSEEWHGREPVDVLDYEEKEEYESDGAVLAELEELRVILENGEETVNVEFGDMPMLVANVATETLEIVGGDQVLEFGKGWDTSKSEVVVGHVYLIAYKTDKHHLEGSTGKHESYEHFFGEEYYKSRGYKVADYEDSDDFFQDILEDGIVDDAIQEGYLPTMVYDTVNSKIKLVGGRYTIEDVGLRD
jgi:hypothetical protein